MHFALPPGATTMVRNLATSAWWGFPYPGLWLPRSLTRVQGHGGLYPVAECCFAMAEAMGLESLRWKGLVYPSVARLTVLLDASIVNVALGA